MLNVIKRYFNAHPEVYILQFVFSFFGYIGVLFVLSMVKSYGALPTVTVTALRKVLTIVMSFFFFEKPFTMQYVWSGLLVLLGISFNIYRFENLLHKQNVLFYFSKNRANLIEKGQVKYCHGFLWAQIICIMSVIYFSIYSAIPDTQKVLQVPTRFNSSRL